jgi:predicted dehydrogenase
MRIALVSFAHVHAQSYARVLTELEKDGIAEMCAVYDDDSRRLAFARERFESKKLYSDIEELARDPDIDAAIVTSENTKRAGLAISLLNGGKHVLAEKPISSKVADAVRMVQLASENGLTLGTAFPMRHHDAPQSMKRVLSDLGGIRSISSANPGRFPGLWFADPAASGGGAIMDHTVHVADLARWFSGKEFSEVYALRGRSVAGEGSGEGSGLVLCKLEDDTPVSVDCSWSRLAGWPTWGNVFVSACAEKGAAVLSAFNENLWTVVQGSYKWSYYGPDADKKMILDFVRAVENHSQALATGVDGLRALEVVAAAYESINRRRPVKVSEIQGSG